MSVTALLFSALVAILGGRMLARQLAAMRPYLAAFLVFTFGAADYARRDGGYVLAFRELNASDSWLLDLGPYFGDASLRASVLSGSGEASVAGSVLEVAIPERLGYVWLSLAPASGTARDHR